MYLTCPKCHNQMQTFTRSGLQVEQCTACRGVFLDYGELERIIQAEANFYQQQFAAQPQPPGFGAPQPARPGYGAPPVAAGAGYHVHGSHRHHGHHQYGHYKHKSFLGELLG